MLDESDPCLTFKIKNTSRISRYVSEAQILPQLPFRSSPDQQIGVVGLYAVGNSNLKYSALMPSTVTATGSRVSEGESQEPGNPSGNPKGKKIMMAR
jgi:hypothetical protein